MAGWHADDFYTEGEPGALDKVDEMILASFKAKVLPRLGLGASAEGTILRRILRWSEEGVHMAPDAKHVENLASLLEVKGAKPSPTPSSRTTGRGQRDVLELLTAAEATVFRRGTGIALYLGPDRFDLQFATKELAQDMQTPSKLSMLRLRRFVRYLLGAADVGPLCSTCARFAGTHGSVLNVHTARREGGGRGGSLLSLSLVRRCSFSSLFLFSLPSLSLAISLLSLSSLLFSLFLSLAVLSSLSCLLSLLSQQQ